VAIKTFTINDRIIGGDKPLIAFPMVGQTTAALLEETETVLAQKPDLVEWRADYFQGAGNPAQVLETLRKLKAVIGDYPMIFTLRDSRECGFQVLTQEDRLLVIQAVVESGQIELLDVEMASETPFLEAAREMALEQGVALIVSSHDFKSTPPVEAILAKLVKAQVLGADIAKVCVMPGCKEDVLNLMMASCQFKETYATIPAITISMSGDGLISRIACGLSGSAITFCAGKGVSAPGQIPASEMRSAKALLEKHAVKK
jgi:3-dehydroquinate dehydratase-1